MMNNRQYKKKYWYEFPKTIFGLGLIYWSFLPQYFYLETVCLSIFGYSNGFGIMMRHVFIYYLFLLCLRLTDI